MQRIADHHIEALQARVRDEVEHLGGYSAIARKAGCNEATVSHWLFKDPSKVSDKMMEKIARAVGYDFNAVWHVVDTSNTRAMHEIFEEHQRRAMWSVVVANGGAGKSTAVKTYRQRFRATGVYTLECKDWGKKVFLLKLVKELALTVDQPERQSSTELLESIAAFFRKKAGAGQRPILLLDQANSLAPSALRQLIYLYNDLEDQVAVILLGTEQLRRRIQQGVERCQPGYDEIERRFGRSYIPLPGCTEADVRTICAANGLNSPEAQTHVWADASLPKCKRTVMGVNGPEIVEYTTDLGRMKRLVEKQLLRRAQTEIPLPLAA